MILLTGVMMLSFLGLFGSVILSRMITDADASMRRVVTARAFYLADAGIQWGRKRLVTSSSATTLGPITVGSGTITVVISQTSIKLGNANTNVYRIESTGEVGESTRVIEELRYRGGGTDKDFLLWREVVDDGF
jgi:hypothetical protein